jgi:hypothetical protein
MFRPKRPRRLAAAAVAILFTGLTAVALSTGSGAAGATSSVGGAITRAEVIARAQYWLETKPPYCQCAPYYPDPQGRTYRPDCSGAVSMAWHLDSSYTTFDLDPFNSQWRSDLTHSISAAALQPGDALVLDDGSTEHIALFIAWADSAHTMPIVDEEYTTGRTMEQRTWESLRGFHAIAYNKIVGDDQDAGTVLTSSGYQRIFASTSAHSIVERYDGSSGWAWGSLGGTILTGAPGVNYDPSGNEYDVYAIATNGALYEKTYDSSGWDASWHDLGDHNLTGGVAAMVDRSGHQHLFATGDGAFWNVRDTDGGTEPANHTWSFDKVDGSVLSGTPAVNYYPGTNEYDVYAIGTGGVLYEEDYVAGAWHTTFTNLGDKNLVKGVTAMIDTYGHQHVFGTASNGEVYNLRNSSIGNNANGDTAADWTTSPIPNGDGINLTTTPKVIYDAQTNTYDIWAGATNGDLYHQHYDTNGWWDTWHDFSGGTTTNVTG